MASATAAHRFYALLPPHVAPESVETERLALLERVQQTLEVLRTSGGELQAHHFRAITTYVELKHELPARLHAELVDALVESLWKEQSTAPLGDVNLQNRALKVLATLVREWKHRVESDKDGIALSVDWQVVRAAVETACFSTPGSFRRASQPWLAQIADCTVKAAEQVRSLLWTSSGLLVEQLWAEFGPTIQDTSRMECFQALATFSLLLSFTEDTADVQSSVEKLLPEWLAAWAQISRCAEWDGHWIKILSRVAKRLPSSHLWDAHIAFIFAKIHDSLALPSDFGAPPKNNVWPSAASTLNGSKNFENYTAKFCVYLMQNPVAEEQPARANQLACELLHTVKGFFHPSNMSKAAGPVVSMLHSLSEELAYRLGREKAGENDGNQLALSSCRGVLDELLQIMLLGIYSKNRAVSMKCALVIKNILCIDPVQYTTTVLDEMVRALDPMAMSQSHLASTSITSMATFLFHLMCGRNEKSTGAFFTTYLLPILKLTLPGIDANDERKTISTVMLYFQILGWLPLVNDSSKSSGQSTKSRGQLSTTLFDDMTTTSFVSVDAPNAENDQRLWELGSSLEEWALTLLSRCFQFFSSRASAAEQSSSNRGGRGQTGRKGDDADEDQVAMQVANMLSLLYSQLSPPLFTQALRQTTSFLSNMFSSASSNGKLVEQLLYSCLQGNPSVAFKQIIPIVFDKLRVTKTSVDVSTLTTSEKIWNLYLLNGLVRFNDPDDRFLLRYRNELTVILRHFLTKEDDKDVYEVASRVLQHLLNALLGVYTHDFRSLPREQWQDAVSNDSGAFQYLGVSVSWKRLDISWHEPNAEEFAFGLELLQDHLVTPLNELKELEDAKDITVKSWSNRLNRVLHSIRGAGSILVDGGSSPIENALLSGAMPLLKNALIGEETTFDAYVELKPMVMARVHELVVFWRENGTGGTVEIPLLRLLLSNIAQLLIWRGKSNEEFRMKEKQSRFSVRATLDAASYAYQKSLRKRQKNAVIDPLVVASRNDKVEMVNFFQEKRSVQQHYAIANAIFQDKLGGEIKHLYEQLLDDVRALLKNTYEPIRAEAAHVMQDTHELYAKWLYSRVPTLVDELSASSEKLQEETVSGIVYMLTLTLARRNLWGRCDDLLARVLALLLKSDDLILNRIDDEAKKTKANAKLQGYLLMLIASWRYVSAHRQADILRKILQAEPKASEHWKFQLLHLVMLYPFLQSDETPIPTELVQLVIRQTRHEVLPVRQVAQLLFSSLVELHKYGTRQESVGELLYSTETLDTVVTSMFDNYKNSNRFAASADGQHAESAPSNWSFGVNDIIRHLSAGPNAFPKSPFLSSVRVLNQSSGQMSNVSLASIKLVENLVLIDPSRFFASGVLDSLRKLAAERVDAAVPQEERQAALSTLADWVAGMLHALLMVETISDAEVNNHIQAILELVATILSSLSVVLIDQWRQVLYLASRPSKHRRVMLQRLEPITSHLLTQLENSFAQATTEDYARQAKWLGLTEVIVVHFLGASMSRTSPDDISQIRSITTTICDRVLKVLTAHALTHQYKIIRQGAGRLLFVLGAYAFSSVSSPSPVEAAAIPIGPLVAATRLDWSSSSPAPSGEDVDGDELNEAAAVALHAKETAMHWLDDCRQFGEARDVAAVLAQLLPVALLSQNHPKAEVAVQAKNTSDAVSMSLRLFEGATNHEAGTVDGLLDLLALMARSPVWKTRGAVIRFLMTFAFYHWTGLSAAQKKRVHELVESFLTDDQREVQAMAKIALRSLIHNESESAVRDLSVRLTDEAAQARVKFPKQRRRLERLEKEEGTAAEDLKQARERLATTEARMTRSVLGMSAIVLAFPHETPAFVPPMFEELGRFLYLKARSPAASFLEKAVKETLLEFRRTHQDNWAETKRQFSRAQLDVLEDVAIAPSYFS